uniref:Hyaluronan/mRNA-binding protein domain-containing protein n=1 Tax=Kalanchoe fedtschenkoi TaxID=63787 RepID=A0A7N0T6G3_KALFE
MSTANPFDLLGHDNNDDPTQLVEQLKLAAPAKKARLQNEGGRGGARSTGRGRGRGHGDFNMEPFNNDSTYGGPPMPLKGSEEGEGKTFERRGGYGGYSNGDAAEGGERPGRVYECHSGTGRDNGLKRDGAGRGNWGTPTDEIAPEIEDAPIQVEKVEVADKQSGEEDAGDLNMEKAEEEKRRALPALKTEERKGADKEFKSMQQISSKKNNDESFINLGSEKDKRKEVAEKEEKAKKSYGGRGQGRGRGPRGGFNGGSYSNTAPPANIEDPGHFPALGVKCSGRESLV